MWQMADDLPHGPVRGQDNLKNQPFRKRMRQLLRGLSLPIEEQSPGCCWRFPAWPKSGPWTSHTPRSVPRPFPPAPRLKPTRDGGLPDRRARAESVLDHRPPAGTRTSVLAAAMLALDGTADPRFHVCNRHTPRRLAPTFAPSFFRGGNRCPNVFQSVLASVGNKGFHNALRFGVSRH